MDLTVPANATATVQVPGRDAADVHEGGIAAAAAPGVTVLSAAGGVVELSVGSGSYRFASA